jgi:hypothetical protein
MALGIREVQSAMKKRCNMKQSEVSHNLDYLVQRGWVKEVARTRDFTTRQGMRVNAEQKKYKISDSGIDRLESATVFATPAGGPQVNITNVQGVTVIGDGNAVNIRFTQMATALEQLQQAVLKSGELSDRQKLDALADIGTIRSQITKSEPDKTIVDSVWRALGRLADVTTIAGALSTLGPLVAELLR